MNVHWHIENVAHWRGALSVSRQVLIWGHRGDRVGEASNPGPARRPGPHDRPVSGVLGRRRAVSEVNTVVQVSSDDEPPVRLNDGKYAVARRDEFHHNSVGFRIEEGLLEVQPTVPGRMGGAPRPGLHGERAGTLRHTTSQVSWRTSASPRSPQQQVLCGLQV